MEELNLLRRLDRVAAPADFELRVRGLLARRKADRPREIRARVFRYSLAGAGAALLAGFVLVNTVFIGPGSFSGIAERRGAVAPESERLPVMETVNYRNEVRNASLHPEAVYILENVSYASDSRIRY
jgi:hypothetical protein